MPTISLKQLQKKDILHTAEANKAEMVILILYKEELKINSIIRKKRSFLKNKRFINSLRYEKSKTFIYLITASKYTK